MKLGPEDVSLLERCPHFRGWYVQASLELGPEGVSLFRDVFFKELSLFWNHHYNSAKSLCQYCPYVNCMPFSLQQQYHSLLAGLLAGSLSVLDDPSRRHTLSLYMAARAIGVLIICLNRRGFLPTIPRFGAMALSMSQAVVVMCMMRYPSYLPASYYRALLKWSIYYTDDILEVL